LILFYSVPTGTSIEVFGEAIRGRATAIVVAHNHPSDNLQPSGDDQDVTRRLRQAGELLGIKLLDHLIFSEEGYLSLLEGNMF
jgi:DNA repair protein RadC